MGTSNCAGELRTYLRTHFAGYEPDKIMNLIAGMIDERVAHGPVPSIFAEKHVGPAKVYDPLPELEPTVRASKLTPGAKPADGTIFAPPLAPAQAGSAPAKAGLPGAGDPAPGQTVKPVTGTVTVDGKGAIIDQNTRVDEKVT